MNLVVPEAVRWSEVAHIVRQQAAPLLERIDFQEEYRSAERLGAAKKSLLFSIQLRSRETTLTNQQADEVRDKIVARLERDLDGSLRS